MHLNLAMRLQSYFFNSKALILFCIFYYSTLSCGQSKYMETVVRIFEDGNTDCSTLEKIKDSIVIISQSKRTEGLNLMDCFYRNIKRQNIRCAQDLHLKSVELTDPKEVDYSLNSNENCNNLFILLKLYDLVLQKDREADNLELLNNVIFIYKQLKPQLLPDKINKNNYELANQLHSTMINFYEMNALYVEAEEVLKEYKKYQKDEFTFNDKAARFYTSVENYNTAREYLLKNRALIKGNKNPTQHVYNLSKILIAISNIYLNEQKKIPEATAAYLREFEKIPVDSMKGYYSSYLNYFYFKALNHSISEQPQKAIDLLHTARIQSMDKKFHDDIQLSSVYRELGNNLRMVNKIDSAIFYTKKALKLCNNPQLQNEIYRVFSKVYMAGGQLDSVVKYQEIYIENERDMKVDLQREKINIANKQRLFLEIKSLNEKNELVKSQKEFNKKIYGFIIGLIIVIFLLIMRIYSKHLSKEKERNEQLKTLLKNSKTELDELSMSFSKKINIMKKLKKELAKEHQLVTSEENEGNPLSEKLDDFFGNEAELEALQVKLKDVKEEFLKRYIGRHPNLTEKEIQLSTLLMAGFSSKQIAKMSFVEERSLYVNRSRLRKKLGLSKEVDLVEYIKSV